MKLNIRSMKNCIDCKYASVHGTSINPIVKCVAINSSYRNNFDIDGRCAASSCDGYERCEKSRQGIINNINAYDFMLAGKCDFILHSTKTNEDFHYKLTRVEDEEPKYFVTVFEGQKNTYAGLMWFNRKHNEFQYGKGKGEVLATDVRIRSLLFVLNKLHKNEEVGNLEVYHLGKCAVCGKEITNYKDEELGVHKSCISDIAKIT